jgi:hypothetical protein
MVLGFCLALVRGGVGALDGKRTVGISSVEWVSRGLCFFSEREWVGLLGQVSVSWAVLWATGSVNRSVI